MTLRTRKAIICDEMYESILIDVHLAEQFRWNMLEYTGMERENVCLKCIHTSTRVPNSLRIRIVCVCVCVLLRVKELICKITVFLFAV